MQSSIGKREHKGVLGRNLGYFLVSLIIYMSLSSTYSGDDGTFEYRVKKRDSEINKAMEKWERPHDIPQYTPHRVKYRYFEDNEDDLIDEYEMNKD